MTNWSLHKLVFPCMFTLLLVLAMHSHMASAGYEKTCNHMSRPHSGGLCGTALSDLVRDLCNGIFHSNNRVSKRNANRRIEEGLRGIMLNKKDAFSYLAKRQTTGTITCECCFNQCDIGELYEYCDFSRYSRNTRSDSLTSQQADQTLH